MEALKVFEYNGSKITFEKAGEVMVNATEMAKSFGKATKDWLRTDQATNFIQSLSVVRHICPTDLVKVLQGGNTQGTWMHEDVAIEFARWLNPEFAIWCNDRIKELVKHGATAINPNDLLNPDFIISLATQLKKERNEKEQFIQIATMQAREIKESAPKVLFADSVNASENSILIADLAKLLKQNGINTGQNKLYEWLRANGYLGTRGDYYNHPTQYAMNLGLFEIVENSGINRKNDKAYTSFTTKVTGKGQLYFVKKLLTNKAA